METYSDSIGRIYRTPAGDFYSVTTMLSNSKSEDSKKSLQQWRDKVGENEADKICRNATEDGSLFHLACESILETGNLTSDLKSKVAGNINVWQSVDKIKPLLKKVEKIEGLEVGLYSKRLGLAGRADGIGMVRYKDRVYHSIFDHKLLGKTYQNRPEYYEDYFIQCCAYALMRGEMTGSYPDKIVLFISSKTGDLPFVLVRDRKDFDSLLIERIKIFRDMLK